MRKLAYALVIIIVIGVTAWSVVTYSNLVQTRSELRQQRREVVALETSLEETERRLARTSDDLTSAQQDLTSVRQDLSSAQSDIATLESKLRLYKETWGSVVAVGVQPPFQVGDLISYETSGDPTWTELLDFLLEDQTDRNAYVSGTYMCGDFARDVHNNAERAGIRAAFVVVRLSGGFPSFGLLSSSYHALNAFKTTDRGLVFIDCTGLSAWQLGPHNRDKIADLRLGWDYRPRSLFPESGWSRRWENAGTIRDVQIYW